MSLLALEAAVVDILRLAEVYAGEQKLSAGGHLGENFGEQIAIND